MIFIATVHWKDSRWIKLQREFLDRYISEPFSVYTYLTDIPAEFNNYFDHIRDQDDPSHAEKLNILAQDILQDSKKEDDIIIFLDGDAFPIAPLHDWMYANLQLYPLIAVQRTENIGDMQPHPCFCVTTTGLWRSISGDWNEGYAWQLENGTMQTDVGGNLLKILSERSIPWLKLHRSNAKNLDDLMFGVYGDIVYHHGSGFRPQKGGRLALEQAGQQSLFRKWDVRLLESVIPKRFLLRMRKSLVHPYGRLRRRIFSRLSALSDTVYQRLIADPDYVYTFIGSQKRETYV